MILLIDSGNSRVKLMLCVRDADGHWVPESDPLALPHDALPAGLPAWLGSRHARIARAVGVNVAGPDAAARIVHAIAPFGATQVDWRIPGAAALGLRNGYAQPERLGADRWMALLGVWTASGGAHLHRPRLLVNVGTATTVDTIAPEGVFVGGLILPGWNLMRDSLTQRTAQLPPAQGTVVDYPTGTHDAITSGIAAAQAGAVLRQWLLARGRFDAEPLLFVAGGAGAAAQGEIARLTALCGATRPPRAIDHPVLDGLAAVLAADAD